MNASKRKSLISAAAGCLAAVLAATMSVATGTPATAAVAQRAGASDEPVVRAHFTVSSFNVLGSTHTVNSNEFAPGTVRIGWGAQLLANYDTSVVGFNELQQDQLQRYLAITDGSYGIYPGAELMRIDSNDSIAWRTSEWQLVEKRTFQIPYFGGTLRSMPIVRLRHRETGLEAYFVNVHNPATNSKHPDSDPYRIRATSIEIGVVQELKQTGLPVVMMGDMNEREYYFCRMTGEAIMKAARGGSNRDGECDAARPRSVSWIFGSRRLGFDNYIEAEGSFVQKITDHRVLFSDVSISGRQFPKALSG